eukprot:TRINITY_DN41617_c0_g1_i1.p1 TRINITY_DN41617_c0_g1~~TRINITY_DN41617_c0_g1_i1.p1  ORF type:complete len:942 (+),score=167.15 TRINITY_DN41617_c0_g1_i1:141-2966(+)
MDDDLFLPEEDLPPPPPAPSFSTSGAPNYVGEKEAGGENDTPAATPRTGAVDTPARADAIDGRLTGAVVSPTTSGRIGAPVGATTSGRLRQQEPDRHYAVRPTSEADAGTHFAFRPEVGVGRPVTPAASAGLSGRPVSPTSSSMSAADWGRMAPPPVDYHQQRMPSHAPGMQPRPQSPADQMSPLSSARPSRLPPAPLTAHHDATQAPIQFCWQCGAQISGSARFCSGCGARTASDMGLSPNSNNSAAPSPGRSPAGGTMGPEGQRSPQLGLAPEPLSPGSPGVARPGSPAVSGGSIAGPVGPVGAGEELPAASYYRQSGFNVPEGACVIFGIAMAVIVVVVVIVAVVLFMFQTEGVMAAVATAGAIAVFVALAVVVVLMLLNGPCDGGGITDNRPEPGLMSFACFWVSTFMNYWFSGIRFQYDFDLDLNFDMPELSDAKKIGDKIAGKIIGKAHEQMDEDFIRFFGLYSSEEEDGSSNMWQTSKCCPFLRRGGKKPMSPQDSPRGSAANPPRTGSKKNKKWRHKDNVLEYVKVALEQGPGSSNVDGKAVEDLVLHKLQKGRKKPSFVVMQCLLVFGLWLGWAIRMWQLGEVKDLGEFLNAKAGLDSWWPERTDMRLYTDCIDLRGQIWRLVSHQWTHWGIKHVLTNILMACMLGIPLEALHGTCRMILMFNAGVIGGGCFCVFMSAHNPTVGMSGGCYALLGMHLADLIMNWSQKRFRWPSLVFLIFMAWADFVLSVLLAPADDPKSVAAHLGGYIFGAIIGILIGTNMRVEVWEQVLQGLVVLVGCGILMFSMGWGSQWPPRNLWNDDGWCWHRQVWSSWLDAGSSCSAWAGARSGRQGTSGTTMDGVGTDRSGTRPWGLIGCVCGVAVWSACSRGPSRKHLCRSTSRSATMKTSGMVTFGERRDVSGQAPACLFARRSRPSSRTMFVDRVAAPVDRRS